MNNINISRDQIVLFNQLYFVAINLIAATKSPLLKEEIKL